MNSSSLLNSEDCPKRQSLMLRGLERESLSPHQLLYRAIEHGLQVESDDPAQAANDELYRLARSRPIETDQSDLIGLADHLASLAEIITWVLRTGPAWTHPDPLPNWTPSSWSISGGLRWLVLCDHWDEHRALQEVHDWRTLEGAIYNLPMTILAVVLGPNRDGRRHGPLTKGWLHPQSRQLRFRKRDGSGFDGNWEQIWRERSDIPRDEWLQAMTEDGVTGEVIQIHPVTWEAKELSRIQSLASAQLAELATISQAPTATRHLSRCFDSIHPCEFRFPCAFFKEPEEGRGFIKIAQMVERTSLVPALHPTSAHNTPSAVER